MSEPSPAFTWVCDPAALADLVDRIRRAEWVALDTESNSMFVYQERICLLQMNVMDAIFLVDGLAFGDPPSPLAPLAGALARPDLEVYMHGGEYDVACLKRDHGCSPGRIFDTQQAASLLGYSPTGYGALVERVCGVELPKGHATYDWATRPLDADAQRYAIDDVVYLPPLVAHLREEVARADIVDEVAIACQAVADTHPHRGEFDPADVYRIKGLRSLSTMQQAILFALYCWRDGEARKRNMPAGRLIGNEALMEVARRGATNFGSLKQTRLRGWVLRELGEEILTVIGTARSRPPALPARAPLPDIDPRERQRETRLKDWRRQEAQRRGVPLQVVLPAKALDHLRRYGAADLAAVPQLGAKRIALYGEHLVRFCG